MTIFQNNIHYLQNQTEHKHAPDPAYVKIAKFSERLKQRALDSEEQSIQVVQNLTANSQEIVRTVVPSKNALWQQVKRARRENIPKERNNLAHLILPQNYLITLSDQNFTHEINVGNDKILLFVTEPNLRRLAHATM